MNTRNTISSHITTQVVSCCLCGGSARVNYVADFEKPIFFICEDLDCPASADPLFYETSEEAAAAWYMRSRWISAQEFDLEQNEGWCWIVYKGRVVEAYHDHQGCFLHHRHSNSAYMSECVSFVQKMIQPAEPCKLQPKTGE